MVHINISEFPVLNFTEYSLGVYYIQGHADHSQGRQDGQDRGLDLEGRHSYQRRKRGVCTTLYTEALPLRGAVHSELSSSSSEDGCWDETCRGCHGSRILTGRRATRAGNTDTEPCLLVKTGNRKLAAHGQSQPTHVFCLAGVMFKKFFALVASILKLRFHIKFWILRPLLKNSEDVNTGSASHIVTRVSWSSERPLPQAGTQGGALRVASALSSGGGGLETPGLKSEGRSAQWFAGQCLTADSLKKRKKALVVVFASLCGTHTLTMAGLCYQSYASGTGAWKGCPQRAVTHWALTLLGQEAWSKAGAPEEASRSPAPISSWATCPSHSAILWFNCFPQNHPQGVTHGSLTLAESYW